MLEVNLQKIKFRANFKICQFKFGYQNLALLDAVKFWSQNAIIKKENLTGEKMKAIVTVVGKDRVGIVAGVSAKLSELGLNIDDISQTILSDFFTMMAVVSSDENKDFTALRAELDKLGESLKVKINIQSSAIFDAMHKI
ncbi:ACT domain-containing protein [Campylobacter concisus]|uniref:ACT domain-containing protein n=1 Tax=Campylobacter concisus TaxID=199 RepID=UPI0021CCCDDA|nr:ACT domain-containing protein [Campylobacter concisus]